MPENFKLYLGNPQCQQILLGVSHDNGYATLLEEHASNEARSSRITLLEGVPFARELGDLKRSFRTTNFPGLFRSSKIDIRRINPSAPATSSPFQPATTKIPSPTTTLAKPVVASYAGAAIARPANSATPPPANGKSRSNSHSEVVLRNRLGQRVSNGGAYVSSFRLTVIEVLTRSGQVDSVIEADRALTYRVKELKLCNNHYLQGFCNGGKLCKHRHDYQPTAEERNALRFVARLSPCWSGLSCNDPKCVSGHKCLHGTSCKNDNCRFDDDMHNVDLTVVKTTRV